MIRRRLARTVLAVAMLAAIPSVAVLGRASAIGAPSFANGDGITVVSATASDARTWHLVVSTTALNKPVRVNVLLPEGYASSNSRYPVLYLMHGTSGGADDWLNDGHAAAATDPYPLIVVMPDAGYDGNGGSWFTNWVDQHTKLGVANWETFHINQLLPWIDANLRTVADRSGRAVAGLSQGGFGAFSYAARHPDLFSAAGSFSGSPDIASNPVVLSGAAGIIDATAVGLDGVEPDAMFGNPVLDNINWQGHNPASLVTNLAYSKLALWSGNGVPGPLDTPSTQIVQDALIEGAANTSSVSFAQVARKNHIAYTFNEYGNGTHSWPYWARDLTQALPVLMATFANPQPAPAAISYRSIDKTWTQWGWTVVNSRAAAQAFSALTNASATGFTVTSPTKTTVTTPAEFTPGDRYRVSAVGGSVPASVVVSATGQITVAVTPAARHTSVQVTLARV